jgi:hypothetical protein
VRGWRLPQLKKSALFLLRVFEIVRIVVQELMQEPTSKTAFIAKFLLGDQNRSKSKSALAKN